MFDSSMGECKPETSMCEVFEVSDITCYDIVYASVEVA